MTSAAALSIVGAFAAYYIYDPKSLEGVLTSLREKIDLRRSEVCAKGPLSAAKSLIEDSNKLAKIAYERSKLHLVQLDIASAK